MHPTEVCSGSTIKGTDQNRHLHRSRVIDSVTTAKEKEMDLVFAFVVFTALVFPPVLAIQTPSIAVIQGNADECPADVDREATRQDIRSTVLNLLQNVTIVPTCGEGLWKKVVSFDMKDPSQQCPSQWREYSSIRSCGRPTGASGCVSVTFTTNNYQYSKVCGRAIGYQFYSPDAFGRLISLPTGTADDNYVDGLSVTHGRFPRKHIWTFAAGLNEANEDTHTNHYRFACPCAAPNDPRFGTPPPSYVGDNYFCEAGHSAPNWSHDHHSEPLWDGQGCLNSECCTFNTPPWFSVQLPSPTSEDIEVRNCGDQGTNNEDTTVELLEIYVQ